MRTYIDELREFIQANRGLSMKETRKRVKRKPFCSKNWATMNEWLCRSPDEGLYNLKVVALKRAIETAKTLADWVYIAGHVKAPYRNRAFDEVLKFDLTSDENVNLLLHSGSERLSTIGWYLQNRRKP